MNKFNFKEQADPKNMTEAGMPVMLGAGSGESLKKVGLAHQAIFQNSLGVAGGADALYSQSKSDPEGHKEALIKDETAVEHDRVAEYAVDAQKRLSALRESSAHAAASLTLKEFMRLELGLPYDKRREPFNTSPFPCQLAAVLTNPERQIYTLKAETLFTPEKSEGVFNFGASDNTESKIRNTDTFIKELIAELVITGQQATAYERLLRSTTQTDAPTIHQPVIKDPYIEVVETADTGEAPFANIELAEKTMHTSEKKTAFSLSDRIQLNSNYTQIAEVLNSIGIYIAEAQYNQVIEVLRQGDGSTNSGVTSIGVGTTSTLSVSDWRLIASYARGVGYYYNVFIAHPETINTLMDLDFFSNSDTIDPAGNPLFRDLNGQPIRGPEIMHPDANISKNQVLMVDTDRALIKYNQVPLTVETERNAKQSLTNTYIKYTDAIMIWDGLGRVVLDSSLTFSSNGIPAGLQRTAKNVLSTWNG